MTDFEKLVIKLLVMIWRSVQEAPGVATYDHDREFIEGLEKAHKL